MPTYHTVRHHNPEDRNLKLQVLKTRNFEEYLEARRMKEVNNFWIYNNEEIRGLYRPSGIVATEETQEARWAGHVASM